MWVLQLSAFFCVGAASIDAEPDLSFIFSSLLLKKKEAAAFALTTDLHRIPACVCITSRAYIFAPLWWTLARNSNKCSREKL